MDRISGWNEPSVKAQMLDGENEFINSENSRDTAGKLDSACFMLMTNFGL